MTGEEDEVPELERVTVLLLPEASAALIQGAAAMGVSRTDFINAALIAGATMASQHGAPIGAPWWLRWLSPRVQWRRRRP